MESVIDYQHYCGCISLLEECLKTLERHEKLYDIYEPDLKERIGWAIKDAEETRKIFRENWRR